MFRKKLFGNSHKPSSSNSNKSTSSAPANNTTNHAGRDNLIKSHNVASNSTLTSCGTPNPGESTYSPRYQPQGNSSRSSHSYGTQSTMTVINQQRLAAISEYIQLALAPAAHLATSSHASFSIGGTIPATSSFSTPTSSSRSYAGVSSEGKLDIKLVERLLLAPKPIEIQDEELQQSLDMMESMERLLKTAGIQAYEWIEFTGREDESKKISIGGQKVLAKKLPFDRFMHEFNRLSQDIQHCVYEESKLRALFRFLTNRDSEDEEAYVDHCHCDLATKKYHQFMAKLRKFEGVKIQLQDIGSFMRKFQLHLSPLTASIGTEAQQDSPLQQSASVFVCPAEMEKLIAAMVMKYDIFVAENGPLDTSNLRPLEDEAIFQSVSGKSFLAAGHTRPKKYRPAAGETHSERTPNKRSSITQAIASTLQAISSSISSSFLSTTSSLSVSSKIAPTLSIDSDFDEMAEDASHAMDNHANHDGGKPPLSPHRDNSKHAKRKQQDAQDDVEGFSSAEQHRDGGEDYCHKRAKSLAAPSSPEVNHEHVRAKHTLTSSSMVSTNRKPQLLAEEDDTMGFESPSTDDVTAFTNTSNNSVSSSWKFLSWRYSSSASTTASAANCTASKIHPVAEEAAVC